MNRVEHQAGFILKSQAFKETSLIHQVLTRDYGIVSIISKGSRAKNSKHGSLLQPFRQLSVSWVGKSDLKTLVSVDKGVEMSPLKGNALYCGFYVSELVLSFLHKHDAHPQLYNAFEQVVFQLSSAEHVEASLRQFEKVLFDEIGYGLLLDKEAGNNIAIQPEQYYLYQSGRGAFLESNGLNPSAILGSTLINLSKNKLTDKAELNQAKRLMRRLIDIQLNGKILKSRDLFV